MSFGGGREGYMSLLNTDMKKELDNIAQFFHLAKDYALSLIHISEPTRPY